MYLTTVTVNVYTDAFESYYFMVGNRLKDWQEMSKEWHNQTLRNIWKVVWIIENAMEIKGNTNICEYRIASSLKIIYMIALQDVSHFKITLKMKNVKSIEIKNLLQVLLFMSYWTFELDICKPTGFSWFQNTSVTEYFVNYYVAQWNVSMTCIILSRRSFNLFKVPNSYQKTIIFI